VSESSVAAESPHRTATIPFSLTRGGPAYEAMRRVGLVTRDSPRVVLRSLLLIAITWVPLVILAAVEGVALGDRVTVPFLLDVTVYARFLLAFPLLIMAGPAVDRGLERAVNGLLSTGIVPDTERPKLEAAVGRLTRMRDWIVPEVLILVLGFLASWFTRHAVFEASISSWQELGAGSDARVTLAGRWLNLIGMPIYSFLVLRWFWRIGIWTAFLRRVSKLELRLVPTHPDRVAGLGFLGGAHCVFGFIVATLSIGIAGRGAFLVMYAGWTLDTLKGALWVFLAFALVLAFGPLLVFTPALMRVKKKGTLEYGGLAARYVRSFDRKWVRGETEGEESLLGTADIQSLADIGNSFQVIKEMRPVPVSTRHVLSVLLAGVLPMLPLLATVVPVKVLLEQLLKLLGKG